MSEPMDEAKKENNPWAICGKNIKDQDSAKYERCVRKVKKQVGYHESTVEDIADLIDEEEHVGAGNAPMAANVAPYVFEHLTQLNNDEIKFEQVEGNNITFTVVTNGTSHRYRMTVDYAGSDKPEQVDPNVRAAQMRRGAAESY